MKNTTKTILVSLATASLVTTSAFFSSPLFAVQSVEQNTAQSNAQKKPATKEPKEETTQTKKQLAESADTESTENPSEDFISVKADPSDKSSINICLGDCSDDEQFDIKISCKNLKKSTKADDHNKLEATSDNEEGLESNPNLKNDYDCEDEDIDFRFENRRDGMQFDVSAISSVGDNYTLINNDSSDAEFDVAISYRIQLLGMFIESPGISTRRIHGMYSMPAWGLNFYNSDDWSFDLFYQYSTRGIEGLEGIQARNKDERAGLRVTGFFEHSQFQAIYSPVSRNDDGSDGIEASLSYSHNWQFRNWNYYANLGMQYRSEEVTPYNYAGYGNISTIDDNLSFSDGINYSAEVGVEYPLTTDWVFGGFVGYNALSERSALMRQDNINDGYRAGVLLTYVF
ncbi:hypothetical protein GCM10009111_17730 [Colwellia asteriadis]|uniref:MipA/OmpV family protein n=1 Tax=Colwellia asteriadis TaxID=517723 RepID=A0ABP3WJC6_9GAMM